MTIHQRRMRKRGASFGVKTGISEATLNAIHFKEKFTADAKIKEQQFLDKQESQRNIENLVKVSEQVKSIFDVQCQGSTMFLSKLLNYMSTDSQRGSFISKGM